MLLRSNQGFCMCYSSTQATKTYSQLLDKIKNFVGTKGLKEVRIIQARMQSVKRPII